MFQEVGNFVTLRSTKQQTHSAQWGASSTSHFYRAQRQGSQAERALPPFDHLPLTSTSQAKQAQITVSLCAQIATSEVKKLSLYCNIRARALQPAGRPAPSWLVASRPMPRVTFGTAPVQESGAVVHEARTTIADFIDEVDEEGQLLPPAQTLPTPAGPKRKASQVKIGLFGHIHMTSLIKACAEGNLAEAKAELDGLVRAHPACTPRVGPARAGGGTGRPACVS